MNRRKAFPVVVATAVVALLAVVALYLRLATDDGQPEVERPTAELAPEVPAIAADLAEGESSFDEAEAVSLGRVIEATSVTEVPAGAVAVIMGLVVDSEGQPVADAEVVARGGNSRFQLFQPTFDPEVVETTTDEAGRFVAPFTGSSVTIGVVAIDVRADGYAPTGIAIDQDRPWERPMGRREVTITLERGAPIIGRVETESGEALAEETVYLGLIGNVNGTTRTLPHGSQETTTDADGRFRFDAVADGRITVGVMPDNMAPAHRMIEAPREEELVLIVEPSGVRLVGFVYHEDTEEPISGVTVTATHQDVRTYPPQMPEMWRMDSDSAGRFEFRNLPAGTHTLRPRKVGLHHNGARDKNARVELSLGQTSDIIELYLNDGITLFGTVVNSETSRPMEGVRAKVNSMGNELYATSNAEGDFTMRGLAPQYSGISFEGPDGEALIVTSQGHHAESYINPSGEEQNARRAVRQWALRTQVPIRGRVVRSTGEGVGGASVWASVVGAFEPSPHIQADHEGYFEGHTAPNAHFTIGAYIDQIPMTRTEQLYSGDDGLDDIEVLVGPTARLRVRVVDASGDPVSGVDVNGSIPLEARTRGGPISTHSIIFGRSDEQGWTPWKEVRAESEVKVAVRQSVHGSSQEETANIRPGDSREVVLRLEAGRDVIVRVIDQEGAPVTTASVYVMKDYRLSQENTSPTGEPGVYRLQGVSSVEATVIMVSASSTSAQHVIPLDEDDVTVTLRLVEEKTTRNITVAVTVLDPHGELVPDITAGSLQSFRQHAIHFRVDPTLDGTFYIELEQKIDDNAIRVPVKVNAPGFAVFADLVATDSEPDESGFVFTTITMRPAAVISGRIVDADTGEPIQDVRLDWSLSTVLEMYRYSTPAESVRTNADGRFELRRLPDATSTISITPPQEYTPRSYVVRTREGESRDLGDIPVDRRAHRTVRLIGPANAIGGFNVSIGLVENEMLATATTDATGKAEFSDAPSTINFIHVATNPPLVYSLPHYMAGEEEIRIPFGAVGATVRLVNVGPQLTLSAINASTIREGIRITSRYWSSTQITLQDEPTTPTREFPFQNLVSGDWNFTATGFYLQHQVMWQANSEPRDFQIPMSGNAEIELDMRVGTTRGRVVDSNGEPVSRVTFEMGSSQGHGVRSLNFSTTNDGTFSITMMADWTVLRISHPDYGMPTVVDQWRVAPGESIDIGDVVIGERAGGQLIVTMLETGVDSNETVTSIIHYNHVNVRNEAGERITDLVMDYGGTSGAIYSGLAPGEYRISFPGTDHYGPSEDVVVQVGTEEPAVATLLVGPRYRVFLAGVGVSGETLRDIEWRVEFPDHPGIEPIVAIGPPEGELRTVITDLPRSSFNVSGRAPDGRRGSIQVTGATVWGGSAHQILFE